ncbi:hypothetical protein Trydic_g18337 [Trypoxylus dichotomus]
MASTRCSSPDDDGYKRFNDDHQVSYGSNSNAIDEMGSRSSLSRDADGSDQWDMNYHEAAIFLEEGENNEKFDSHPRHPSALPAYLLVHNNWYYGLDLAASLILLTLALAEEPSVANFKLPIGIHATLEMVTLGIIAIELALKLRWTGIDTVIKHKRTTLKGVTLIIMFLETLVVMIRRESHFRVTRALRPIFLIDTRACGNVRRFIRQILQSLPPILDMLGLLMFFVCSYALLGYFLFSENHTNLYFKTLPDSFVSMFVLLTTANFPDVMMPSYATSKFNAIFYISYISICLYVLMNLMLAVVYETFTGIERDKFRKLLLHKRRACNLAFRLLVSKSSPTTVRFRQFLGMMRYYSPRTSLKDIVLMFRLMNTTGDGALTSEQFMNIYDVAHLKWHMKDPPDPWFSAAWPPLRCFCRAARRLILWPYFDHVVYMLIIGNGLAMLARVIQYAGSLEDSARNFIASWDTYLFMALFLVEAMLKIIALGWNEYMASGWNVFDLSVTLAAIFGSLLLLARPSFTAVVVLRPLRLLRLFKMKKRYRDIFGTLVLLSPLMWSTAIVMMVVYYFFAIIGMELFSKYDLKNCCINTTVQNFYHYSEDSTAIGYYYLNSFTDLLTSGVTLFELTVVNNWFIIMDAFASVAGPWSRIFFMSFYLFTMVVLTIVVASVLEAFRFRIQYKKQTSKRDEEQMLQEEVVVEWSALVGQVQDAKQLEQLQDDFRVGGVSCYIGRRRRTREVLQKHMYTAEIKKWLETEEIEDIDNNTASTVDTNDRLIAS